MKVIILPILFLLAYLAGCSDNVWQEEDSNTLNHHVYVMPLGVPLDSKLFFEVRDTVFLEANQTYRFYADHSIGNATPSSKDDGYASILWEIDGENYNVKSLQLSFQTPGTKSGFFETVDLFDDTLRTSLKILVNTPSEIHLESPINGYNQIERNPTQGIPLKWKVSGIDEWESASCTIYASEKKSDLFESVLGTVDCQKTIYLNGINASEKITGTTYWAVVLQVESANGKLYRDTSETFSFSTKTAEGTGSILVIPFLYSNLPSDLEVTPFIHIYNSDGTIDQSIEYNNFPSAAAVPLPAQSNMKVCLVEGKRTEYKSDCQIVDIPENTVVTADTIVFRDVIPPQLKPVRDTFNVGFPLEFFAYDDGSGINPFRLHVIENGDTINHYYSEPTLNFKSNCSESCKLQIVGEDNARNPLPSSYWLIKRNYGLLTISGPFAPEGT